MLWQVREVVPKKTWLGAMEYMKSDGDGPATELGNLVVLVEAIWLVLFPWRVSPSNSLLGNGSWKLEPYYDFYSIWKHSER